MDPNSNDVEADATSLRSSILIPAWMDRQLTEIAARTLSSRSQVIRRLLAEGLEREAAKAAEEVSA
jgi:metal-responsive CopG/Arc/MetJ family transcriptional regulator